MTAPRLLLLLLTAVAARGTRFTVQYRDRQVACARFDGDPARCLDAHALCECAYCRSEERCLPLALPVHNATPRALEPGFECTNASSLHTDAEACRYALLNQRITTTLFGLCYAVLSCTLLCGAGGAGAAALYAWDRWLRRRCGEEPAPLPDNAVLLDTWLDSVHRADRFTIDEDDEDGPGAEVESG